jgi:hypothetical protein
MINYSQMPSLGQTVENYNANIDQIKANAKNDEVFREINKKIAEADARIKLMEISYAARQAKDHFRLWPMYSADYKRELDTPQKKLMYNAERLSNVVFNPLGVMAGATPEQVRARRFEKRVNKMLADRRANKNQADHGMEEDSLAPAPLGRIKAALGTLLAAKPEDEFEVFSPSRPINSAMNAASAALLKRAEMYNQMMGNPMRAVR